MGKKTDKIETNNCIGKRNEKESDDVEKNVDNKSDSDVNKNNRTSEENCVSTSETGGSLSRLRRRAKTVSCPPRIPSPDSQPSTSAKKMKVNKSSSWRNKSMKIGEVEKQINNKDNCENKDNECNVKNGAMCAAIGVEKLKFDIKIDPNKVDRYTDSGFTKEGSTPESPETRRQRIDIISRQCHLHPANKKYNQGPVEKPPLITPGKMVGYTPGGQRHEVDLNFDRPAWFNSEYARMQWDCATKVNVSRMFHDLETGMFLPDNLDPNIERKYFAEEDMAAQQATEHFEEVAKASSSKAAGQSSATDLTEEEQAYLKSLEAEKELLELNKYAVVRLPDFEGEVVKKLRKALDLTLTPLMIKKNPMILDTLEILATQCIQIEVVLAARALLDKIKGMFQVPESQEFREFFAVEVEKLKEKTKDISGFDILMMAEEPQNESDDRSSSVVALVSSDIEEEHNLDSLSPSTQTEEEQSSVESEEEWIPIENGDSWIDSHQDPNNIRILYGFEWDGDNISYDTDLSSDDDSVWFSNDENEDSLSDLSSLDGDLEDTLDHVIGSLISEE